MTNVERDRYYHCASKRPHWLKSIAQKYARRTPPKFGRRATAYQCRYCALWHVGHKNARPKRNS